MPIFNRLQLLLMGFLITALYITGFTYCALSQNTDIGSKSFYKLLVPDIIFLISLNILGFYVHRQRDIILHMIFLTKRENIEETIILKYAKDQEVKRIEYLYEYYLCICSLYLYTLFVIRKLYCLALYHLRLQERSVRRLKIVSRVMYVVIC